MPKSKPEPSPLQRLISLGLRRLKITPYVLAQQCGWEPGSIYRRLSRPTSSTSMERMLAALEATVTVRDETVRLRIINGEVCSYVVLPLRYAKKRRKRTRRKRVGRLRP